MHGEMLLLFLLLTATATSVAFARTHTLVNDADDETHIDYKRVFERLLSGDSRSDEYEPTYAHMKKYKRFLKSILSKIFPSSKTATTTAAASIYDPYNRPPQPQPSAPASDTAATGLYDDAFYRLRMHCLANYDAFCSAKRHELYELVKRCSKLPWQQLKYQNNQAADSGDSCAEVMSIYCYVYFTRDLITCFGNNYELYVPGSAKYASRHNNHTASTTTTTSTRHAHVVWPTSTFYKVVPLSTHSRATTTTTTTKPTTTTSTTTTSSRPTTKSTSTTKLYPGGGQLASPFDGPVQSVPHSAEKLKQIGNYCLKLKQRDANCDRMLALLKDKFKTCERKPKSDLDCQMFKVEFCSAFVNFPCCVDVLAGRSCSGKS